MSQKWLFSSDHQLDCWWWRYIYNGGVSPKLHWIAFPSHYSPTWKCHWLKAYYNYDESWLSQWRWLTVNVKCWCMMIRLVIEDGWLSVVHKIGIFLRAERRRRQARREKFIHPSFCQKCPFSSAKKWHFGCRNKKTDTTFCRQLPPKIVYSTFVLCV